MKGSGSSTDRRRTLDLLCVSSTGIMRVDLLCGSALVQAHETVQQVVASGVVVVASVEVREVVA